MKICLAVLLGWSAVACGSGIESLSLLTGPSRESGSVSVRAGDSGAVVSGVLVHTVPDGVAVEAPGFLRLVTSRSGALVLWPVSAQVTMAHSTSLAYSEGRIVRLGMHVRQVGIEVGGYLGAGVSGRIQRAVDSMNAAQENVRFVVGGFSSDLVVSLNFTTSDPAFSADPSLLGITYTRYVAALGVIQSAKILIQPALQEGDPGHLEAVMLHELGHVMGLWHTPNNVSGVMTAHQTWRTTFTPEEVTILRMQYRRLPGTILRDDTEYEGVSVASASESTEVVRACILR